MLTWCRSGHLKILGVADPLYFLSSSKSIGSGQNNYISFFSQDGTGCTSSVSWRKELLGVVFLWRYWKFCHHQAYTEIAFQAFRQMGAGISPTECIPDSLKGFLSHKLLVRQVFLNIRCCSLLVLSLLCGQKSVVKESYLCLRRIHTPGFSRFCGFLWFSSAVPRVYIYRRYWGSKSWKRTKPVNP